MPAPDRLVRSAEKLFLPRVSYMPMNFHPAATRAPAVLNMLSRGVSNRRKREVFILRSVGAGCGDGPGKICRGPVSER